MKSKQRYQIEHLTLNDTELTHWIERDDLEEVFDDLEGAYDVDLPKKDRIQKFRNSIR